MTREMKTLQYPENSRKYVYAGFECEFKNVIKVGISNSGTHYIETEDGLKHIVSSGWKYISLSVDEWTF